MAPVKMDDVARRAGVNKGTVSRALRGDGRISSETRRRIWDAARELGYEVNAVASGLSSKRTGVIGLVMERTDQPWLGDFLKSLSGVLARCRWELLFLECSEGVSAAAAVVRRLQSRKVDGLIWAGSTDLTPFQLEMPLLRLGDWKADKEYRLSLEQTETLARVRALAQGKTVRYRGGPRASMSFLGELQKESLELQARRRAAEAEGQQSLPAADEDLFIIADGVFQLPEGGVDLFCGDAGTGRFLGVPCLSVSGRTLGVLAARVMVNVLRQTGVRPRETLLRPLFTTASGDPFLA